MVLCPNCGSARIHLSKRKGILERVILASLFVRPFRCELCDERFFRHTFATDPNGTRTAASDSSRRFPSHSEG
jgi:hypothetical protein